MDPWKKRNSDYAMTIDIKPSHVGDTEAGAEILAKGYIEDFKSNSIKKVLLSTKDFEEQFSTSISQQKNLRGRVNNPLPYIQTEDGGKVLYDKEEVLKWFRQYNKGQSSSIWDT